MVRARWYDPVLGRFAQADTIIPGAGNPLAWDRYAYTLDNPLRYSDPSGHGAYCGDDYDPGCLNDEEKYHYRLATKQPLKFERSPVAAEDLEGVQWFGATENAYYLWKNNGDKGTYNYCQDLHCGLDLLAAYGSPVYAGTYGKVLNVWSTAKNNPATYDGPWKIQIQYGDYVVTYGHTDGSAFVQPGAYVTPDTVIAGVGDMGAQNGDSGYFDHIHLEVRGPGGWGGDSNNPMLYMSPEAQAVIVDAAKTQTIEPSMSRFSDGVNTYGYPPPSRLMPSLIHRTPGISFWE